MINPDKIFGRLGNRMFQMAFCYAYAKDHDIDFYFQDPYFFEQHSEAIRTLFGGDIPPQNDKVAIHVRRGDYVDNPFYVDLMKTDYYERAMAQFPEREFIIFSDDPLWCERQEIFEGCEIDYHSEIEAMNIMASCSGHIIANSSFSWWGAWLSPYSNKIIAPKEWYSDGNNSRTVLPANFIRI